MVEFDAGGARYRADRLTPLKQLAVGRRLIAVLGKMASPALLKNVRFEDGRVKFADGFDWTALIPAVVDGLTSLSDADAEVIVMSCLSVASRRHPETGAWQPLTTTANGTTVMMFQDVNLSAMLTIVQNVVADNLSDFFVVPRSGSGGPADRPGSSSSNSPTA